MKSITMDDHSAVGSGSGVWWCKLRSYAKDYVASCDICRCKSPRHKPSGLLTPLPLPTTLWSSILLDFMVKLARYQDSGNSTRYCRLSTVTRRWCTLFLATSPRRRLSWRTNSSATSSLCMVCRRTSCPTGDPPARHPAEPICLMRVRGGSTRFSNNQRQLPAVIWLGQCYVVVSRHRNSSDSAFIAQAEVSLVVSAANRFAGQTSVRINHEGWDRNRERTWQLVDGFEPPL